ncbi:hypothetical protein A462_14303 [Pseudomonas sp. Ag1]|nr:hypothetical protein A462_14303 [Pseudomonas sp. Ag1]
MERELAWRGSLLPLGCEAAPTPANGVFLEKRGEFIGAAAQPSGSKLPRHRGRGACEDQLTAGEKKPADQAGWG